MVFWSLTKVPPLHGRTNEWMQIFISNRSMAWMKIKLRTTHPDTISWHSSTCILLLYGIQWLLLPFAGSLLLDVINSGTNFNLKGRNWVLEGKIIYKLVHEWSTNTFQYHDDKQVVNGKPSCYGLYYVP